MHQVEVDIDACPEHVWAVLADVPRWPDWADAVLAAEPVDGGVLVVGGGVRVRARRQATRTWRVAALSRHRGFTWVCEGLGSAVTLRVAVDPLEPGAEPDVEDVPAGRGPRVGRRTRLRMSLEESGPAAALAGVLPGVTRRSATAHVDALAAGLRRRCEQRGGSRPALVTPAVGRPV